MSAASDNTDRVMRDLQLVLNKMAKEPESKRLTDVEKALRELIREQMRKMGVEHISSMDGSQSANYVASIAYSQAPTISTRYIGPLFFYYDLEGVVTCKVFTVRGDNRYNQSVVIEKLDIYTPDFVDNVETLINKYLPVHNRSPHLHKIQISSSDYSQYIPDTVLDPVEALSRFQRFRLYLKRFIAFIRGEYPHASQEKFVWEHVIQRHFNPDDAELLEIEETFKALMRQPSDLVRQNTKDIVKSLDKK